MAKATGIETRTDASGRKRYRGVVYSKATGKRNGPWGSFAEARVWRSRAMAEIEAGAAVRAEDTTLRTEAETFLAGIESGTIRDSQGHRYRPSTVRSYKLGWSRIDPELGAHRLQDIKRADIQAFIDRMAADGKAAGTVRNTLDPLRRVYARAVQRDRIAVNPCDNLEVPAAANGRERFASRQEARQLIAALPAAERALWATAFYAGLRRGELRALRWSDIDFDNATIHVRRSWDDNEGEGKPKTAAGTRKVPIVPVLAGVLRAHEEATGRKGEDLVFGRTANQPFYPSTVRAKALAAWRKAQLTPITLHECRHTAASLMIAAGCNAKALSVVMGHAAIGITFDRYGHLMPGGEGEVGRLLAAYVGDTPL